VMSGPDHRFEFVNEAYERLFGMRDIVGKTLREALPNCEGQEFVDFADDVFRNGEMYIGPGLINALY
jgi:two-component system, LuxR family, sensor kinase FixL